MVYPKYWIWFPVLYNRTLLLLQSVYSSLHLLTPKGCPGDSVVKNLPAVQESQVQSLDWKDPLEKRMAAHLSILAWRTPWTEEPGGLQSIWGHRVGHDWAHRDSPHLRPSASALVSVSSHVRGPRPVLTTKTALSSSSCKQFLEALLEDLGNLMWVQVSRLDRLWYTKPSLWKTSILVIFMLKYT